MDWQFRVGLGVALVFGFAPFAVKAMPHWITWPGIGVGLGFISWALVPYAERIPLGAAVLFIAGLAAMAGGIALYWDIAVVNFPPMTNKESPSQPVPPAVSVDHSPGSIIAPSGGTNTIINKSVVYEANGLYQSGSKIGTVQQSKIDEGRKTVLFGKAVFTAIPDHGLPLEFQGYVLECTPLPSPRPDINAAQIISSVFGLQCKIIGRR